MSEREQRLFMLTVTFVIFLCTTVSYIVSSAPAREVEQTLDARIVEVAQTAREADVKLKETIQEAELLATRVQSLQRNVAALTTEEIASRLTKLEQSLANLETIINPNASEILNVARMRDEVLARQGFERRITDSVGASQMKIESVSAQIVSLHYWIWGALLAIITGLFGAIAYLAKRLESIALRATGTRSTPLPASPSVGTPGLEGPGRARSDLGP